MKKVGVVLECPPMEKTYQVALAGTKMSGIIEKFEIFVKNIKMNMKNVKSFEGYINELNMLK
jgi:glycine cleavage system regulatory protein